jgi:hypothetical protein
MPVALSWRSRFFSYDPENLAVVGNDGILGSNSFRPADSPLKGVKNVLQAIVQVMLL